LSWHWVFLINLPLGAAVLALSPGLLHRTSTRRGSVDVAGALAVTGALVLAVYTIVTANDRGWTAPGTLASFVGAAALLGAFVLIQQRRAVPLVPLQIFRAPNLSVANGVMALLGAAWIPMWFFLNLYLQQVQGYSALDSGLALLPMTLAITVLMVRFTARFIGRFGPKNTLTAGLVILGGGIALFVLTPTQGNFLIDVLPASLIAALGMSLSYIPAMMSAMSGARPEEMGLASGLVNTSYQVGSALGLAATVALVTAIEATSHPSIASLNTNFHAAFVGAAAIAVIGALAARVGLAGASQATAREGRQSEVA
jgi:MFS family permease